MTDLTHNADLLKRILPFLDKHLALGLLDFYGQQGLDVREAMTYILEHTALDTEGNVKPQHEKLIAATTAIAQPALDEFFESSADENYTYQFKLNASELEHIRSVGGLSIEALSEQKRITKPVMEAVMQLAYLYYDKGSYGDGSELLTLCRSVTGYDLPMETLLWGQLMCDTGACNWQSAIEMATKLRRSQTDEEKSFRQAKVTSVRDHAWLLHWVLFPFFKGGSQYSGQLLQYVFDVNTEVFQCVVESVCPHLLRYVCAAALLNRNRSQNFNWTADMVDRIYEYSDPLTQLVSLIRKPSFDDALNLLPAVQETVQSDYFLCGFEADLMNNARHMIFQRYMAVHSVVSIPYMAEKLDMNKSDAEVWLVNLISDSKLRAKIDSVNEQLNVEPQPRSVELDVCEKLDSASRK